MSFYIIKDKVRSLVMLSINSIKNNMHKIILPISAVAVSTVALANTNKQNKPDTFEKQVTKTILYKTDNNSESKKISTAVFPSINNIPNSSKIKKLQPEEPSNINISIDSLIPIAQQRIEQASLDEDNNNFINSNKELNMVLLATESDSVEDLTNDKAQEILDGDAIKIIYTSFTQTDNELLADSIYKGYARAAHAINSAYVNSCSLYKELSSSMADVNKENIEEQISFMIDCINKLNEEHKKISGKDFAALETVSKGFKDIETAIKTAGASEKDSALEDAVTKIHAAQPDIEKIAASIKRNNSQVSSFLDYTIKILAGLPYNDNDLKISKERLVYEVTPHVRDYFIKTLIDVYNKVQNQETGDFTVNITKNHNNTDSNIKKYKTGTEIFKLIGKKVFVYDMLGRYLRTEDLNPTKHKKFFNP